MRPDAMSLAPPGSVRLGGLLGTAIEASRRGRLSKFIVDERSPAIELFHPARVSKNQEGDWYGEHAGKWLYAASRAAADSDDGGLADRVRRVAAYLVGVQGPDGYLGTYAPDRRFMRKQAPKPESWDGAPSVRTWDMWTHIYMVLGLLEAHRRLDVPGCLDAACRIGDLCWETLSRDGIDITDLGNHHGMSATVLMDAAVELHLATGERRYLDLAVLVLEQADRNPRLALLTQALAGADASQIGNGKAYQLIWNMVALAKLYRATGSEQYLRAARNVWQNIREHHLTLGGGPFGGIGHRSREVFNPAGVFSPHAYVETCSTCAWMQLNRELLSITGEAEYAEEIERSAYNDLLGAMAPNGEDWCYYSFPNGRRVHTTYWRCCKSSGAMALEELPFVAYGTSEDGIKVNLLGPSTATLQLREAGAVRLEQRTTYPFEGELAIHVEPARCSTFAVDVRVPSWAASAALSVNDSTLHDVRPGSYARIARTWRPGDQITLSLPMQPLTHVRTNRNVQESRAPDGSPIAQEVLHFNYAALTRGPLVYATGLIDGYKVDETLPRPLVGLRAETVPAASAEDGSDLRLHVSRRSSLIFNPYFRAGGCRDGTWRLTWMSLAPESIA
jgi:uncharacterized protein